MTYNVMIARGDQQYPVGALVLKPDGWRFLPWSAAHSPSRKSHATPAAAIPRWVGRKYQLVEITKS